MKKFVITESDKQALCRSVPEFQKVVEAVTPKMFEYSGNVFFTLVDSIISQQLSIKAAGTIFGRFKNLVGDISPENIIAATDSDLRAAGLSARKAEYIKGIADAAISGAVDFEKIAELEDAEIIKELTMLKGVGVWTVEMMLIFALGRKDILSFKDLGIRRGIMILYGLEDISESEFEIYKAKISPYGTLASMYLWRMKDGE